jgi:hypothetical protein
LISRSALTLGARKGDNKLIQIGETGLASGVGSRYVRRDEMKS